VAGSRECGDEPSGSGAMELFRSVSSCYSKVGHVFRSSGV
jgi:hypothetical protein